MRKTIYWISTVLMLFMLLAGADWFGPEIKRFSLIILFLWVTELVTGNWEDIKREISDAFGPDKK